MMKTKYFVLFVSFLFMATMVNAKELSLKKALSLAVKHSYQIKQAQATQAAYEQNLKTAISERLPTLTVTAWASYKNKVPSLDINLPGGFSFSKDFGLKENYQTDLRLNLPLFTGGKITGGINLSRATYDYYQSLANASVKEIDWLTRIAYLNLYKSDKLIASAQAKLKRANIVKKDVQSMFAAGAADSVDILEADLAVTKGELLLQVMHNKRRQNEITLITLLGLKAEETITLTDSLFPIDEKKLQSDKLSSSKPELVAAKSAIQINQSLVNLNRSDFFPTLVAFGGYSYGKPNIDPFHNVFNDYFTLGASLNWSFNLGKKTFSKVSMAKFQLKTAQQNYNKIDEEYTRQANLTFEKLKLAFAQYQTALREYKITSANYRLARQKYLHGALSTNRLLEIETNLSEAEAALATTQVDFYMIQSQYYYVIGSKKLEEGL
ncbi:MAG: TolC family protein [FCB group bacterium]|nr:TolC family protein [FCB group bacterium]